MSPNDFLSKNLSFFPSEFQQQILALAASPSELLVEMSRSGNPVPKFRNKFLHSSYDPLKEAKTFCQQYAGFNGDVIVVFGFCFGYHVEELRRLNPKTEIVVFEMLPELLAAAFRERDFSELLEKGRIRIVAERKVEDFASAFQDIDKTVIKEGKCQIVLYKPAIDAAPPEFHKVVNAIEVLEMGRKQPRVFNKMETRNIFENAALIADSIGIASIQGLCRNQQALIVGAGPSLDNTLPFIRQYQEKLIVIAVDAAVTALKDEGVRPDIIVSVDPQDGVLSHLGTCLDDDAPLFSTPVGYHELLTRYRGRKVFLVHEESPFCADIPELRKLGTTKAGGSVSCFSIDIALQLGCRSIFLTGLDSSFPYMMPYAKKSIMGTLSPDYIYRKKIVQTDDIFGGSLATHQNLYDYLRTIELQIKTSEAEFFVIGGIGGRIEGAKPIHQRHLRRFVGKRIEKGKLLDDSRFRVVGRNEKLFREIIEATNPVQS